MSSINTEKREKTDHSAKQFGMENQEEEKLETALSELSIKDKKKDTRIKFLINVPVGVTSEMSQKAESHCQKILDLLEKTAFSEEDKKTYLNDIAVIFGLNARASDEDIVRKEFRKAIDSKITFKICWFTWDGEEVPFQYIREDIKNHNHTKSLVRSFKEVSDGQIYFCFFDADTVDFNGVLSSYRDIITKNDFPTVMSTGYLFPDNHKLKMKSERDRNIRITTAEHFPLGTYYPEPNLCVLLPDGHETLPESFIDENSKNWKMESPVLIRQVKKRSAFTAVFAKENPIITSPVNKYFHTHPRTWAKSAYVHQELKVTEEYKRERFGQEYENDRRKANGVQTSVLMKSLSSDEEARDLEQRNPFEGAGARQVFKAAEAVRYKTRNPLRQPEEESDEFGKSEETTQQEVVKKLKELALEEPEKSGEENKLMEKEEHQSSEKPKDNSEVGS